MHKPISRLLFKYSIVFITLGAGLLVNSCQSEEGTEEVASKKNNFFITGKVTGADGMTAYLETQSNNGVITVASSQIDGSEFSISTSIPGMGIYQLRIGEGQENAMIITAAEGDKISISGDFSDLALNGKVSGVDWGASYNKYMEIVGQLGQAQNEIMQQQGKVPQEELVKQFNKMKAPLDAFSRDFINAHPSSTFNIVLTNSLYPTTGFKDYPQENLDALKLMAASYSKTYPDSPITRTLTEQVMQIESGLQQFKQMEAGTKLAPDILLESPEGKQIKLSSLKGKLVLVDFWASWCGPCRKENPNLVKLYNKYKDKGFTIYSVSLDTEMSSWEHAIAVDGLIWPNHVSDLKGWKTYLTKLYGFTSIPYTVLVGKDGNIIAENLRGEMLEQKIAEILK